MKLKIIFLSISLIFLTSCESNDETTTNTDSGNTTDVQVFTELIFTPENAYFSTNGSMTTPVNSDQAQQISDEIDITYIYNYDYDGPGFFDPIARSQEWYWDDYYNPWLDNAVKTLYYSTNLTKTDFDEAVDDPANIEVFFNSGSFLLSPHGIFPEGTCIGGRQTLDPDSIELEESQVFGFQNMATGKKGLIYIRDDQQNGWPLSIIGATSTKIDLVIEN